MTKQKSNFVIIPLVCLTAIGIFGFMDVFLLPRNELLNLEMVFLFIVYGIISYVGLTTLKKYMK